VSAKNFKDVDGVTITVDVTNTGRRAGKEIVQVYVHDQKSGLIRPAKELKGFAKVELQPGETKSVSIQLDFRSFAYYHPQYKQWITEYGEFDLLIGASSADIRCRLSVTLESTIKLPCILNNESTMREWMADPRGRVALSPHSSRIEAEARKTFGGAGEARYSNAGTIAMDIMEMLNDMPLVSVLMWQKSAWDKHPEDMVAELLQQAHAMEQA
jgi:beta-glucosidase